MPKRTRLAHIGAVAALALLGVLGCGETVGGGDAGIPVKLETTSVPDAVLGQPYSVQLVISGGTAPMTFALENVAADLHWLGVDPGTGKLSGIPDVAPEAAVQFTARVRDPATTDSKTFNLRVHPCIEGTSSACSFSTDSACMLGVQTCSDGGFSTCNGGDASNDTGTCGASCGPCGASSDQCVQGRCKCGSSGSSCGDPNPSCCGGGCVDVQNDVHFCGSCDNDCTALAAAQKYVDAGCVGGTCSFPCQAGYKHCFGDAAGCPTHIASDVNNCGNCGFICPTFANTTSAGCQNGQCTYTCDQAPWANCDGQLLDGCETNLDIDPSHCGSCAGACPQDPHGTPTCSGGTCSFNCNPGYNLCGGGCISNTDLNNCGGCGNICSPPNWTVTATTCSTGTCQIATCYGTMTDCNGTFSDGCETDISSSIDNCGACGHTCACCTGGVCKDKIQTCDYSRKPPCTTECP